MGTKWIANESTWIPPHLVMSNRQKFLNYWPTVQYWCRYTDAIDCSIRTFHYQDNQFSWLTFPVSRPCRQCLHLSSRPLSPGHLYSLSPSTTTQLLQRYKLQSEEDRIINKATPTFLYSFWMPNIPKKIPSKISTVTFDGYPNQPELVSWKK